MDLPYDIIETILTNFDCETILHICKSKIFEFYCETDRLIKLLSKKLNVDVNKYNLNEIEYLSSKEYMMFLLNHLAQGYHSGFGFSDRGHDIDIHGYLNDENFRNLIRDDSEFRGGERDEYLDELDENHNCISMIKTVVFYPALLKEKAKLTIPYHTVILKYEEDEWMRKPKEWYNLPPTWWTGDKFKDKILPYLNTKPYININDPFMKITISSDDKGSDLTIDDILFATIGMASDSTRCILMHDEEYKILSDQNGILTLEPNMDNWST